MKVFNELCVLGLIELRFKNLFVFPILIFIKFVHSQLNNKNELR